MNKRGFTLAEILISVCIIGVIGALMATAFNHAKPDSTKMMYLKAYDSLVEVVQYLTENDDIYGPIYTVGGDTYNVKDYPLLNLDQPRDTEYRIDASISGNQKFGRLLADLMKGNNITSPSANIVTFNSGTANYVWTVTQQGNALPNSPGENDGLRYQVRLAIGDERNPQRFTFCVQPNGVVYPVDSIGATFLRNRRNVRSRNDIQQGQAMCTATYSITGTGDNSFKIQDTNDNNKSNKDCQNIDTEVCCKKIGGTWDGSACVTDSDENEEDAKKECDNQHGHWLNDTCYTCEDDEKWDGTACVKKNDSNPDEDEEEAEIECEKLNGHWYNGACYTCKNDEKWDGTACVKKKNPTEEEKADQNNKTDPTEDKKKDICSACGGIWVNGACLNGDKIGSKPCACYQEALEQLQK